MTMEMSDTRRVQRFRQWPIERVVGTDSTHAEQERAEEVRDADGW
jgi:hypothetical protein